MKLVVFEHCLLCVTVLKYVYEYNNRYRPTARKVCCQTMDTLNIQEQNILNHDQVSPSFCKSCCNVRHMCKWTTYLLTQPWVQSSVYICVSVFMCSSFPVFILATAILTSEVQKKNNHSAPSRSAAGRFSIMTLSTGREPVKSLFVLHACLVFFLEVLNAIWSSNALLK